jgi:hypothetical protein
LVVFLEGFGSGRNCRQTLSSSLLLFSSVWLDFEKRTITSWAKQEMPMKCQCIFIYQPVIKYMMLTQNLWWLKHQVTERCV